MKILLTSHGSTGDIYPVIGLGKALREAGHTVSYASAPLFRDAIEKAGLNFLPLPPDWGQEVFAECMRELDRQTNPVSLLRQIYRSGLPFMGELIDRMLEYLDDCDVCIGSYVFPHYGVLARRKGVPFGVVTFCHSVVASDSYPPENVPALRTLPAPVQRLWNRNWWKACNSIVDWAINDIIKDILEEKELPPMQNFLLGPADLCLVGVSQRLMEPKGSLDERFKFTGYLRWQADEDPEIENQLKSFCEGEKVPILNFGSVTFDHIQDIVGRFQHNWPSGKKIIIQSGWAGLSVDVNMPEFKVIGKVSHDQLFKHASCVIHHGGAGTTASVLHAGVPQVIVPHFGDQPFWASEVKRLGCGVSVKQSKWPELLPKAVKRVENKKKYLKNAQACATSLSFENGGATAVKAIEEFVARHRAKTQKAELSLA